MSLGENSRTISPAGFMYLEYVVSHLESNVVKVEEVTHREANTVSSEAETNSHRSSTFLTEVDEEDGGATASLADIVAAVGEVETVGSIKDVDEAASSDAKQPSPAPQKKNLQRQ